jgi:hypothetical protein
MARNQLIQVYRGTKASLGTLSGDARLKQGELAYTTDTREVFVGGASLGELSCIGGFLEGVRANRPATGIYAGTIYHATDEDIFYFYNGTAWFEMGGVSELSDKMNLVPAAVENSLALFDAAGQVKASAFSVNDALTDTDVLWSSQKIQTEIDDNVAGISWQEDVQGMIDELDTQYPDDGNCPVLAAGHRYVIRDITATPHANWGTLPVGLANGDIIEYDGTTWTVSYDISVAGDGAMVYSYGVQDPTVDAGWRQLKNEVWTAFFGFDEIIAGHGLEKEGAKTFNIKLSDIVGAGLEIDSNMIRVAAPGNGLEGGAGAPLAVKAYAGADGTIATVNISADGTGIKTDNTTIDHNTGTIRVKAQGIGASQLGAVVGNGLEGGAGSVIAAKADLTGGANLSTSISVSTNGLAVRIDDLTLKTNGLNQIYVAEVNGGTF